MMSMPTWHLEYAKVVLNEWYEKAEGFLRQEQFFLNLVIPSSSSANDVKRKALHCKTAGLVWSDRYKLLLDAPRKYENVGEY